VADPIIIIQPVQNTVQTSANVIPPIASTASLGVVQLAGDLGGVASAPLVLKIQGTPIGAPPGGTTQFLRGDGTWAVPAGGGGGVQIGGDLGGTNSAPTVISTHLAAPLPLAQGGTGQTTQAAALTALAGTQVSGRYLRSDGTNTSLSAIQAADVPVLNQNTTGTAAGLSTTLAIGSGGTGQTSASAAFNALSPVTTLGDLIYGSGSNANSRLAGSTSSTKQFLTQTGTGTVSAAPAWGTIQAADVPTLNQNTTGTSANVTGVVAIANGGSGQSTRQNAINALTGTQSAGTYLRSDGVNATLTAIQATDVPTLNQNTTGTASNVTGTVALANGGTGQTTAAAAYNALSPMTTLGDIEYESGTNTAARLPGNTSATKQFLTQTGTGTASAAPAWGTISASDVGGTASAGQVLTATSPTATAWAYSAASAGPVNTSALRFGLVSETIPLYQCNLKGNLASGTLSLALLWWPAGKTLSKLSVYVGTAGTTLSGTNSLGLYSSTGTLLTTTGDMTTAFGTTGWQEGALGASQTPTADTIYYVGVLTHAAGTLPAIQAFNLVNTFGVVNGVYGAITFAGQTNHASFTPSSGTLVNGAYWFGAR
jgi:hypothetical protein